MRAMTDARRPAVLLARTEDESEYAATEAAGPEGGAGRSRGTGSGRQWVIPRAGNWKMSSRAALGCALSFRTCLITWVRCHAESSTLFR